MKKLALTFLILVLVSGCSNPFSIRMCADYFPLQVGNKWVYNVGGEASFKAEIEVMSYDTFYTVTVGGEEMLIERRAGEVNIVYELTTTYLGEEVFFGTIHEPYLSLPFIENDNWEREFKPSTVYKGDTVRKSLFIAVDSVKITTLTVPSGKFNEVYCIRRTRIEDEDSLISYEWYAPNVGLIRKETLLDSVTWELEDFTPHEE